MYFNLAICFSKNSLWSSWILTSYISVSDTASQWQSQKTASTPLIKFPSSNLLLVHGSNKPELYLLIISGVSPHHWRIFFSVPIIVFAFLSIFQEKNAVRGILPASDFPWSSRHSWIKVYRAKSGVRWWTARTVLHKLSNNDLMFFSFLPSKSLLLSLLIFLLYYLYLF